MLFTIVDSCFCGNSCKRNDEATSTTSMEVTAAPALIAAQCVEVSRVRVCVRVFELWKFSVYLRGNGSVATAANATNKATSKTSIEGPGRRCAYASRCVFAMESCQS